MDQQQANGNAAQATGPTQVPKETWKEVLVATWKEAGEDNVELIAAGVAFYAFLAFVPLLSAFVLSYGLIAEPSSVVSHMQTLTNVMPQNAAQIIGEQLMSMTEAAGTKTGFALLAAIAIALYGASKGAGAIMTALNIAFEVTETRGFIKRTAMAIGMAAGALLVLFLAILAISAIHLLEDLLPAMGGVVHVLLQVALFALAALTVMVLLAALYRYGPNRPDAKWKWITPGSITATILWVAATAGFGFYVSNFGNYNATYGSLGAVVVFLTWLYLTAYIILMSAELNSELERRVAPGKVQEDPAEAKPAAASAAEPAIDSAHAEPKRQPRPAAPVGAATPPSAGAVLAKWGAFAIIATLLGRPRRASAA